MRNTLLGSAAAAGLALALGLLDPGLRAVQPPQAEPDQPLDVLARGPVHEAYAQPNDSILEPTPVVPQQPPQEPVPEDPPLDRPEGDNVQWIGGYWAWDAERNDFIWVSGTYRNLPPGQRFVAGYWQQTPEGWRWVPGFYMPEAQQELPFVPEPPPSLENGPSFPPPDDNCFYVPGNWMYQQTRYVWQPGFYARCRPNLVWCPPRYQWTPAGFLFCRGYWDQCLERRGLLCAPVAFRQPIWRNPGWRFQPNYVVGYRPMLDSFFVRPRHGHYYFGDYYGAQYAKAGFQPWHAFGPQRHDPLFAYYQAQNRGNPQWQQGLQQTFVERSAGRLAVPPRTLVQQNVVVNNVNKTVINNNTKVVNNVNLPVVSPLSQAEQVQTFKVRKQQPEQVTQQRAEAARLRELGQARQQQEVKLANLTPPKGNGGQPLARALQLPAKSVATDTPKLPQVNVPDQGKPLVKTPNNVVPPLLDLGKKNQMPDGGKKPVTAQNPVLPNQPPFQPKVEVKKDPPKQPEVKTVPKQVQQPPVQPKGQVQQPLVQQPPVLPPVKTPEGKKNLPPPVQQPVQPKVQVQPPPVQQPKIQTQQPPVQQPKIQVQQPPVQPKPQVQQPPPVQQPKIQVQQPKIQVQQPVAPPKAPVQQPPMQPKPQVQQPPVQPKPQVQQPPVQPKPQVQQPPPVQQPKIQVQQPKIQVQQPPVQPKAPVQQPPVQPKPQVQQPPVQQPKIQVQQPKIQVQQPVAQPKIQAQPVAQPKPQVQQPKQNFTAPPRQTAPPPRVSQPAIQRPPVNVGGGAKGGGGGGGKRK